MITKEEITIKVPLEVAEAYRNATEEEREQLQLKIATIMQSQFTTSKQEAIARLRNTMDEISQEAQERGLTPEILESILNDDE
jgi:glycerate-2-kinase